MAKTLDDDFPIPENMKPVLMLNEHDNRFAEIGLAKLREPFPAHQISKLPKPTKKQTDEVRANFKAGIRCKICGTWHHPDVIHLDYVGHAALTDRLLDADPAWYWEPLSISPEGIPVRDKEGGMWIKLTVCGVTRLGYGHAGDKTGGDAIKEIIGDALRNAAMRFGAALDLWHKGDLHIEEETKPEPRSDADADELESKAAQVRIMIGKGDVASAALYLNTLGFNGERDNDMKELVCGRLESNIRSGIRAYEAIIQAKTVEALNAAWKAAPKHSHDMLLEHATKRKAELTSAEYDPQQAAA